jgi:hypothetical protein
MTRTQFFFHTVGFIFAVIALPLLLLRDSFRNIEP